MRYYVTIDGSSGEYYDDQDEAMESFLGLLEFAKANEIRDAVTITVVFPGDEDYED